MGMGLSKRSPTNHHQYKTMAWKGKNKAFQVRIFGWLQAFNIERSCLQCLLKTFCQTNILSKYCKLKQLTHFVCQDFDFLNLLLQSVVK